MSETASDNVNIVYNNSNLVIQGLKPFVQHMQFFPFGAGLSISILRLIAA